MASAAILLQADEYKAKFEKSYDGRSAERFAKLIKTYAGKDNNLVGNQLALVLALSYIHHDILKSDNSFVWDVVQQFSAKVDQFGAKAFCLSDKQIEALAKNFAETATYRVAKD